MAKKKLTRSESPLALPEYLVADASAFQALQRGEAEPEQQKRALRWLIEDAAGAYEQHFYATDRETAFSLGRAFVGQQVVKLLKINTSTMTRD